MLSRAQQVSPQRPWPPAHPPAQVRQPLTYSRVRRAQASLPLTPGRLVPRSRNAAAHTARGTRRRGQGPPSSQAAPVAMAGPLAAHSTGPRLRRLRNTRGHCMPRPPQVFPGEAPVTTPLH